MCVNQCGIARNGQDFESLRQNPVSWIEAVDQRLIEVGLVQPTLVAWRVASPSPKGRGKAADIRISKQKGYLCLTHVGILEIAFGQCQPQVAEHFLIGGVGFAKSAGKCTTAHAEITGDGFNVGLTAGEVINNGFLYAQTNVVAVLRGLRQNHVTIVAQDRMKRIVSRLQFEIEVRLGKPQLVMRGIKPDGAIQERGEGALIFGAVVAECEFQNAWWTYQDVAYTAHELGGLCFH